MSEITSRPYHPAMACEACCFGSGEHAEWCEVRAAESRIEAIFERHRGAMREREKRFAELMRESNARELMALEIRGLSR